MLDLIPTLIAVLGSSVAGYVDLKTTEIPDWSIYSMLAGGIIFFPIYAAVTGSYQMLIPPVIAGLTGFIFGVILYMTGQWGGGDAKLLGAILFLIPAVPESISTAIAFPMPLSLTVNTFLIGAVYIILYSFIVAMRSKKVRSEFMEDLRARPTLLTMVSSSAGVVLLWLYFKVSFGIDNFIILYMIPGIIGIIALWRFLKTIESKGFTKRIPTSKLKEDDMIGQNIPELGIEKKIIRGLTKREVSQIRKLKKTVLIRDGVRFGPVFTIAIIVTLLYGDLVFLVL